MSNIVRLTLGGVALFLSLAFADRLEFRTKYSYGVVLSLLGLGLVLLFWDSLWR